MSVEVVCGVIPLEISLSILQLKVSFFSQSPVCRFTPALLRSASVIVAVISAERALRLQFGGPFLSTPLLDLPHLIRVFAEGVAEFGPHFARNRDGVPVRGLHLADPHEDPVLIGAHVEEEALVVDRQRGALRELRRLLVHTVVVDEFGQSVAELDETLRRQSDGLALRASQSGPPINGLPDP